MKHAVSGARLLQFEGITVRSDSAEILRLALGETVTCPQVAKLRKRSAGAMSHTLRNYAEAGLLREVQLREHHAPRLGARKGYRTTDMGKRLLAELDEVPEDDLATDPEDTWPRPDPDAVVRQALRTQPSSIFDLGRIVSPPPKPTAPPPQRINSVFDMGRVLCAA